MSNSPDTRDQHSTASQGGRATPPDAATQPGAATQPDAATQPGAATPPDASAGADGSAGSAGADGAVAPGMAQLQRRLAEFAAARDWGKYHTPKNLSAALSVEAGELVEIFQWLTPEQSVRVMDDPESAHRVEDEVADVLAYLLQFCSALGVDPLAALASKIDRNEQRFPSRKNGHSME